MLAKNIVHVFNCYQCPIQFDPYIKSRLRKQIAQSKKFIQSLCANKTHYPKKQVAAPIGTATHFIYPNGIALLLSNLLAVNDVDAGWEVLNVGFSTAVDYLATHQVVSIHYR